MNVLNRSVLHEANGMSRKGRFLAWMAMAALLAAGSLAHCCRPSAPGPQFKLRFGLFPVMDWLPYFVMQAQGFDKENGLRLEERPYPGGAAMIDAIAADALDVGYIGSVPLISAAERGLIPGTVVPVAANSFADPDHPHIGVLVGRSINRWKDLEGKQIGVNAAISLNSAAIRGRLQQEGIHNYTLVEIPAANMGLAVAGGNVAAATMVGHYLGQSLLRGDGKLLGWIIGGPPLERMEATLVVFRTRLYRSNPQAVKAFLRAQLQAVRWINQNPQEARAVFVDRLKLSREVGQKMTLLCWPLDARSDPALLEEMQPLLIKVGLLKALIPASHLYDETLLQEVLAGESKPTRIN